MNKRNKINKEIKILNCYKDTDCEVNIDVSYIDKLQNERISFKHAMVNNGMPEKLEKLDVQGLTVFGDIFKEF